MLVVLMFLIGAGSVLGAYAALTMLPAAMERRALERRLRDVSVGSSTPTSGGAADDAELSLVMKPVESALPLADRVVANTRAGSWLGNLIQQSAVKTSPGSIVFISALLALVCGFGAYVFTRQWWLAPLAAGGAACLPTLFLMNRRTARLRKFEEQFPEALDMLARALRAGHAFQTALGMGADELKEPVGPEFRKTFDQQNYGLPLREALGGLSERVPLMDVRFFVTAVMIQRETGGNLSEILENLAHVVRERFKILRQVRVHTAHGRFTAFVLLALPAALAAALMVINPEHMRVLFFERVGQTMLVATLVLQTVGFVWIRRIIKIEV
jgi:tight adherence protein B